MPALKSWLLRGAVVLSILASDVGGLAQSNAPITRIEQFNALSPAEAQAGRPIRIDATVTYCDLEWGLFFFQQGTQASFIPTLGFTNSARGGDRVELTGWSAHDGSTRFVYKAALKSLGTSSFPEPLPAAIKTLDQNTPYWVSLTAQVRRADTNSGRLKLSLYDQGQSLTVYVMDYPAGTNYLGLCDARVRLQGVNGSQLSDGRVTNAQVFVPDFRLIEVIVPAPTKLKDSPKYAVKDLVRLVNGPQMERRVRIRGQVAPPSANKDLRVADPTGFLSVPDYTGADFETGELIDVWGYPRFREGQLVLEFAWVELVQPNKATLNPSADTSSSPLTQKPLPTLIHVDEIRGLDSQAAGLGYPVRLEGIITYADTNWNNVFFQDGTGGIYLQCEAGKFAPQAGQRVELEGKSEPGGIAPMVAVTQLRLLGKAAFPQPRRLKLDELTTWQYDSEWVQIDGVVNRTYTLPGHTVLEVLTGQGRFEVLLPETLSLSLDRAWVRFRGVCATKLNRIQNRPEGIRLHVPSFKPEFAEILTPAGADPFDLPEVALNKFYAYDWNLARESRVKIVGKVTLALPQPEGVFFVFYLQDATAGIKVLTAQTNNIRVGDTIEAVGFPSTMGFAPRLENALVRKTSRPVEIRIPLVEQLDEEVFLRTHESQLVCIEAELLERFQVDKRPRFVMRKEGIEFVAAAEGPQASPWPDYQTGSYLRLTGVMVWQRGEGFQPNTLRLRLRDGNDIAQIRAPPWWSGAVARRLLLGAALAIPASLIWVMLLRRKVREQTELMRRKLKEEAALEARYRDLYENANDLLFTLDLEGHFTSLNRAMTQFLGCDREAAMRRSLPQVATSEDRPLAQQYLAACRQGASPANCEIHVAGGNGKPSLLEVNARLIQQDGQPEGFQVIARDVTERRSLEQQLRQSQKMESVGQLAAGVAHDFNNLLTVIQGHANLLLSDFQGSKDGTDSLKEIAAASQRASNLTRQLLAFSRKQHLRPVVVDVNELICNLGKMLQCLLGETIALEFDYAAAPVWIQADVGMLEQVIVNLAVNARDAMPRGGQLRIGTEAAILNSEHAARHAEARAGRFVCLRIADTGTGMSEATLNRIFEPFFTTKEVGKGTGLGLATAYGIVKQHQGWIEVQSQIDKGTRFEIFLPASEEAPRQAVPSKAAHPAQNGHETLLVVEDEPALRAITQRLLSRQGYRVFLAESSVQALEIWAAHREEIQLVLTDLVMPHGLTGCELAERLLAEKPSLVVLFMSGYSLDLQEYGHRLKEGINFLAKPFDSEQLVQWVRQSLDNRLLA